MVANVRSTDHRAMMKKPEELPVYLPITFKEIVAEIVRFTDLTQEEVEQRVWMQALEPGWNVIEDARRFGVTPFRFDEKMICLYTEGDGFIFDSLVYWSKPARRLWIEHALNRIRLYADRVGLPIEDLKILMYDFHTTLKGQYDFVLSFEVLEHLPEPVSAIQAINAALKTGGIAIITE